MNPRMLRPNQFENRQMSGMIHIKGGTQGPSYEEGGF